MKFLFSEPFQKDYKHLPKHIQQACDKALEFLSRDPRRSSLRIRKIPGTDIWYGRVTRAYRLTFGLRGDVILLRRIGAHKILNHERK